MSFFSKIGDKIAEMLMGRIITDFGTLPTNQPGWAVSITLRQKAQRKDLVFKWKCGGDTSHYGIEASPEVLDRLETILQETRQQIQNPAA